MFGALRSGSLPVLRYANSHLGFESACGESLIIVLRSSFSGIQGLPQSRPFEKVQSSVRMMPLAPAALARSRRCTMTSRPPLQYIWKSSCEFTAATSSIERLPNELRPIGMPRFAAARATATSPSGCTACTPVGEMMTGIEMSRPKTEVFIERSACRPATCGASPS
ncbi:unannotated protein [freshwater metagenome]|uniref:Unannotated protein n=1 Tax=freshwater metagenome TaxID=449393 RepID=A0A6J6I6Z3_9ZZZZ